VQPRGTRKGTRERHRALLELLRRGTTQVDDLSAALGVSASTIRRDLTRLTTERQVARTYGGAVVPEVFHERPLEERAQVWLHAKATIAAAAREMVPAEGTIFIDTGTTCSALARLLVDDEDGHAGNRLVVVTRGLQTASTLTAADRIDVVILGGLVRHLSHGVVGPLADLALDRLSFSVAFLGADAVDPVRGIGEPTLEETAVKERVAAHSQHVVVLADSSKLQVTDVPAWTRLDPGWTLITDAGAPGDLDERCGSAGVRVLYAGQP
jgi:DeoR/GlpR family transcriptional regulator of sugar metabolism